MPHSTGQSVPFQVLLKVRGDLLQPEISFGLDMAELDRGALGGSVYAAVLALNEREDELNRQVFSLLVLNQFFPAGNNDGASGGSVNIARNSVSNLLSNQLNALSDKLFGESGFSLDLGLDSFQDFEGGTGQDRTQLNVAARQRLFDDRLVISIGGQVAVEGGPAAGQQQNALFGDVEVEYLLTPAGMWRAKAFRKNQFESIVDGQLIITGGSLIFNREFNYFKELWRPRRSEEEEAPKSPEQQLQEVKEEKEEKEENEKP
ncbi:translocation/assembly module TamB domain-containing protein [Nitritalea halalkaliphila]|uniref:translocation/assembly module TamB domain-containing protein n=1 Tax=Nitritalea halalkaliphila TaxID=590849 RepID=UPI00138A11BD|nr:translocation/assembly module TamB domain-containing protein [Nitritalea halalkaliphila]